MFCFFGRDNGPAGSTVHQGDHERFAVLSGARSAPVQGIPGSRFSLVEAVIPVVFGDVPYGTENTLGVVWDHTRPAGVGRQQNLPHGVPKEAGGVEEVYWCRS